MDTLYLGVDVGTGGVRVGAFNAYGILVAKGEHATKTWYPPKYYVEHSSGVGCDQHPPGYPDQSCW